MKAMMRVPWMVAPCALAPWLWAGCGPDLSELEVRQRALEREVDVLGRHVGHMRSQMQAMGMLPTGPAGGAVVAPTERIEGIAMTARRVGEVPTLPPLPEPERRPGTACGWRFFSPWLDTVSDITLERTGSGRASPIRLLHDGVALTPHAAPPRFERECGGAFRVQPRYVFFSPSAPDQVGGEWTLALDERVPVPRADDGRGMYWVYPGTALEFSFEGAWAEEWGPFSVQFDARLLAVGVPEQPRRQPQSPAEVSVLGQRKTALDNRLGLVVDGTVPPDQWTLTVTTPEFGPWVLVETLLVGNSSRALVVTAEDAR